MKEDPADDYIIFYLGHVARHNIIQIIQKLDAQTFVRFRRVCKWISILIEDSIEQYRIRMSQNISITYILTLNQKQPGKIYLVEKQEKILDEIVIKSAKASFPTPKMDMCYSIEELLKVLRGLIWWNISFVSSNSHFQYSSLDNLRALIPLKSVLEVCVPQWKCLNIDDSESSLHQDFAIPQEIIAMRKPLRLVIAGYQAKNIRDLVDNLDLEGIPEFALSKKHTFRCRELDGITELLHGKKKCILNRIDSRDDWSELNAVLREWQISNVLLEYLKITTYQLGEVPSTLIQDLDLIPIYSSYLNYLTCERIGIAVRNCAGQPSTIRANAWVLRSRITEGGYPVYGLLMYKYDVSRRVRGETRTTISFRKLSRSSECICDNPICVETFAQCFYDFVAGSCYPIDLRELCYELLEKPAVIDLFSILSIFIWRQQQFLTITRKVDHIE